MLSINFRIRGLNDIALKVSYVVDNVYSQSYRESPFVTLAVLKIGLISLAYVKKRA